MTIDGDDEFLGINVFKVFNYMYQTNNLSFAYSNNIVNWNDEKLSKSHVKSYKPE